MKKIFDIRHIVILLMVGIIVFLQFFVPPQIEIEEKLVYDTIPQEVIYEVEVEVPYEVEVEKIVEVPAPTPLVDTSFILQEYYVKNFESDTITLSNNQGVVYLFDSISQNKVVSRNFSATIKPKIVREPAPEPPKVRNQVYVGLNGALSHQDWVNSLGTSILLKTKNDKVFQLGGGVANRTFDGTTGKFYPYVTGGVYWKLKFNRE
jgi:hypothetical protein